MIKIVYETNGAGKTLYATQESKNGAFVIGSQISKWLNKDIISHEKSIKDTYGERIKNFADKLIGKDSSLFQNNTNISDIKITDFKNYLKKIDFFKHDKWFDYAKLNVQATPRKLTGDVSLIWDSKNLDAIKNVYKNNPEIIDYAIYLNQLIMVRGEWPNRDGTTDWVNDELKLLIQKIKNQIGTNEPLFNNVDPLILIGNVETSFSAESDDDYIKGLIVSSHEFSEMLNLKTEMENKLKSAFQFNVDKSSEWKIQKDKSLKLVGGYSEGEKVALLFRAIFQTVKNNKVTHEVIIDDALQSLDFSNLLTVIEDINSLGIKSTILTHNPYTYDLIKSSLDDHNGIYETYDVDKKITPAGATVHFLKKTKRVKTIGDLLSNILGSSIKVKTNNESLIIPRMLTRYQSKRGALSDIAIKDLELADGLKHFKWLSNNVMHYNDKINTSEVQAMLCLPSHVAVPAKAFVDSIEVIDLLIAHISHLKDMKYGLCKNKVLNHLSDVKTILIAEQKLLANNPGTKIATKTDIVKKEFKTRHDRLMHIWDDTIAGMTKKERNKIAHALDKDIQKISK